MSAAGLNWNDVILGMAAAGSTAAAWFGVHMSRSTRNKEDRAAEMRQAVHDGIHPIDLRVLKLQTQCDNMVPTVNGLIVAALEPVKTQLNTLNTKIDPVWKALEELAVDMAKNLHHPDPDRAEFDALLDHFMAGTLTVDEDLNLRRLLNQVKTYRPGDNIGFTVHDGEPTYAAILLRTMELSRIRRRQEQRNE
jgi:hypothetical protein